jgi:beta-phosphoglucomutase-like phosphatase (HAD superfamily)
MDFNNMTADDLYTLAKQREIDERKWIAEENKQKIADLREERKQLQARHKKEINEVNSRIRALGGKIPAASATGKGRTGISAAIVELLDEVGELDTTAIREKLNSIGVSVGNLGQTLAYLKKNGKVASVSRGVYKKPE